MYKIDVKFHDGSNLEGFRDRYEDAVTFKVRTLQWGIQQGSRYRAPAHIEEIKIVEVGTPSGDAPKRKTRAPRKTGGRAKPDSGDIDR